MSTTKSTPQTDGQECRECGERFDSMDELVDHLSDDHQAFDWLVQGRPMRGGSQ